MQTLQMCCEQSRLEECLKKQEEIQQALDVRRNETEKEKESSEKARMEWEREREAMKEEISELRGSMRENYETLKKVEGKHKVHTGHFTKLFSHYLQNARFLTKNTQVKKPNYNHFSSLHNTERM